MKDDDDKGVCERLINETTLPPLTSNDEAAALDTHLAAVDEVVAPPPQDVLLDTEVIGASDEV